MSWLVHRWLLLNGIILLVFKDCQSLFLRHTQSGKCITRSEELVYNNPNQALPYFVVMTDNCLDDKAQFRYLDSELLHNIEKGGTLLSPTTSSYYNSRWAVYKGVSTSTRKYQERTDLHRLKQTDAGSLFLYDVGVCAEPSTTNYVIRKTYCETTKQEFTFGSVTNYGTKMENVHCSPRQHMVVKRANYGDFNRNCAFNDDKNIDTQCNALTNCQVKSRCGGKRSCELIMDNNLLPSPYCSNTSKEIYTEYTCVDSNSSSTTITAAPNIRLRSSPYQGFIQIKDGSTWRYVNDINWNKSRQKMLCQHLGFKETDANAFNTYWFGRDYKIATGDLLCYNTQPSGTSCCIRLVPSTAISNVRMSYARCKICDKPLLKNTSIFPDSVFSGRGDSYNRYKNVRITKGGWCASRSGSYLSLDLKKEYHITRVVVMGDREQTKWSESYSLKYSHDTTYKNSEQITGNQNGYQASTTLVDIYNVRHIKIESTGNTDFCLRIELCGEDQSKIPKTISTTQSFPTTKNSRSGASKEDDGTTVVIWHIVVVSLVSGIILGVLLSYIVSRTRRRSFRNRKSQSNPEPQASEIDRTYQELDLTKMNTEDNHESLRLDAASNDDDSTYTELDTVRDVENNYQALT